MNQCCPKMNGSGIGLTGSLLSTQLWIAHSRVVHILAIPKAAWLHETLSQKTRQAWSLNNQSINQSMFWPGVVATTVLPEQAGGGKVITGSGGKAQATSIPYKYSIHTKTLCQDINHWGFVYLTRVFKHLRNKSMFPT